MTDGSLEDDLNAEMMRSLLNSSVVEPPKVVAVEVCHEVQVFTPGYNTNSQLVLNDIISLARAVQDAIVRDTPEKKVQEIRSYFAKQYGIIFRMQDDRYGSGLKNFKFLNRSARQGDIELKDVFAAGYDQFVVHTTENSDYSNPLFLRRVADHFGLSLLADPRQNILLQDKRTNTDVVQLTSGLSGMFNGENSLMIRSDYQTRGVAAERELLYSIAQGVFNADVGVDFRMDPAIANRR